MIPDNCCIKAKGCCGMDVRISYLICVHDMNVGLYDSLKVAFSMSQDEVSVSSQMYVVEFTLPYRIEVSKESKCDYDECIEKPQ